LVNSKTTLVVTLGGKPQLVTFLLDLLLSRGETIDQVVTVYIAHYSRSQNAYEKIKSEFIDGRYNGHSCSLRGEPIQVGKSTLKDIRTPEEVETVRQHMHRLLAEFKSQNQRIQLGLSGGRRLISLIAFAAAMQYLTPVDHVWHLNVPYELDDRNRDGKIMHVPPNSNVFLVPVPFVPWVAYFPNLEHLLKRSPQEIGETSMGWLSEEERDRCQRVWNSLTRRQQEVLAELATGQTRQEVAQILKIAVTTVDSHRDSILEKCCLVWEAQSGEEFDVRFLRQYFAPYLAGKKWFNDSPPIS
jgi:CRISPR-associated protein Csx14